mgnify:CR=1 FL=1
MAVHARTLLERILWPGEASSRKRYDRQRELTDSIVRHLTQLLNSRAGCALTVDDYGMPDLSHTLGTRNEMRASLEAAIRQTIQRYEPRLRRVVVAMEEEDEPGLNPKFRIGAELVSAEDMGRQVSFATVLDPNGKMSIW